MVPYLSDIDQIVTVAYLENVYQMAREIFDFYSILYEHIPYGLTIKYSIV